MSGLLYDVYGKIVTTSQGRWVRPMDMGVRLPRSARGLDAAVNINADRHCFVAKRGKWVEATIDEVRERLNNKPQ
jgi:hypothetical protein